MSLSITLHPEHELLMRGKDLNVRVVINATEEKKIRGIQAKFNGYERTEATYTVTTTDHKGRAKTETRTAVEHHYIVQQEFLLAGTAPLGFFSGIGDAVSTMFGGGQNEILPAGEHEFQVTLNVPHDAPATLTGTHCRVAYQLKIHVDIPLAFDKKQTLDFPLTASEKKLADAEPAHVVYPDEAGRSFWQRTFVKDVTLNLAVDRNQMRAGDLINGMLTIDSAEPLKLNRIRLALVGDENCMAQGHSSSAQHRIELDDIDAPHVIGLQNTSEFSFTVPEFKEPVSAQGKNFAIVWFVEIRLEIPWATDPVIRLPITLV